MGNTTADADGQYGGGHDAPGEGRVLSVAIVGAGIVGVILAHGLIKRGVHVAVYERASEPAEIGVGIAFTAVSRKCMELLSPAVIESLYRVGNKNELEQDNYWDAYRRDGHDSGGGLLCQLPNADMAWCSCLRSHFLNGMVQALPSGTIHFDKELVSYEDSASPSDEVILRFADGTSAAADALVGCDGIRSSVRRQLFSASHPRACYPSYTHKTCYRAVIPMAAAEATLGQSRSHNHCMLTGPGAHILSYPIAQHTLVNVVTFLTRDEPWAEDGKDEDVGVLRMARLGTKAELETRFADWRPEARALVAELPETPTSWGIFDMADHPAPWYAKGRVCLAGDAAHASSPHHGAGAGMGVEDALVLATGLGLAQTSATDQRATAVTAALKAFDDVRYERSQWLVRSSREAGNIYEWAYAGSGSDAAKIRAEIQERQRKIWDFDVDGMVEETKARFDARLDRDELVE